MKSEETMKILTASYRFLVTNKKLNCFQKLLEEKKKLKNELRIREAFL
jgi:hypothetical protein